MSTTTCTCCRGRRCVRVRAVDEISFDAALRRLRDKLARERRAAADAAPREPARQRDSRGSDADPLPRPWEMTRGQFEAAAEPGVETNWGTPRFRGLSRSVLRHEVHFLLRCAGGPLDGYRVRVPAPRADLYEQPHRAFVEAALADGLAVPSTVLTEYPELRHGRSVAAPPRLDATTSS
jgi:hypothetical protein